MFFRAVPSTSFRLTSRILLLSHFSVNQAVLPVYEYSTTLCAFLSPSCSLAALRAIHSSFRLHDRSLSRPPPLRDDAVRSPPAVGPPLLLRVGFFAPFCMIVWSKTSRPPSLMDFFIPLFLPKSFFVSGEFFPFSRSSEIAVVAGIRTSWALETRR